ncbi:MAG: hypothetical protein WCI78_11970 [Mycobacterium sp.]
MSLSVDRATPAIAAAPLRERHAGATLVAGGHPGVTLEGWGYQTMAAMSRLSEHTARTMA